MVFISGIISIPVDDVSSKVVNMVCIEDWSAFVMVQVLEPVSRLVEVANGLNPIYGHSVYLVLISIQFQTNLRQIDII